MTRSISTLLLNTAELRAGSVLTEQEINALKKRWHPHAKHQFDPYEECITFMSRGPFMVSKEQTEKGLKYLRALMFRKDGSVRVTKWTSRVRSHIPRVLRGFDRFELVEWHWDTNTYGIARPFPIYRTYSTTGEWFDYIARPWQAGSCEVV